MSNVVFILGAGASRQCGAPLMSDFLDVAATLLQSRKVEAKRDHFERVFAAIGALQIVHSKSQIDLNNIESIFTILELSKIIQSFPQVPADEIPQVIASLKELIVKTLEVRVEFPLVGRTFGVPAPYAEFAGLIRHFYERAEPRQTASVISFNYDVAVDMAMYRAGLGPDYIIENSPGQHFNVPLLKLHGSLNWATEISSKRILPLHIKDYLQKFVYGNYDGDTSTQLHIGTHLAAYFEDSLQIKVEDEPVIVPPSWNKADYHQALTAVWASAAKHLSEAEHIFIIGYSLPETDAFFRNLYSLGSVGKNPLRRFAVFNPDDSGEVDKRFRSLLGPGAMARYEYHQEKFNAAIVRIRSMFPEHERF